MFPNAVRRRRQHPLACWLAVALSVVLEGSRPVGGWCLLSSTTTRNQNNNLESCSRRPAFLASTTTCSNNRRQLLTATEARRYDDDDDEYFDLDEEDEAPRRRPRRRRPMSIDEDEYYNDDESSSDDEYENKEFSSRDRRSRLLYDEEEDEDTGNTGRNNRSQKKRQPARRSSRDVYSDQEFFWEGGEEDDSVSRGRSRRRRINNGNYYDEDPFDDPYLKEETADDNNYQSSPRESEWNDKIEWEEIVVPSLYPDETPRTTARVLLPPSPPSMHPLPSAILHFVGGTFFGSAPNLWYAALLEELVKHTQCAIVVTPLPVITPLNTKQSNRPLNHVQMAKQLKHQFQYAYRHVIQDEYNDKPKALAEVPIAGLGHSLGSRLLVVLATLMKQEEDNNKTGGNDDDDDEEDFSRRRRKRSSALPEYQYKSLVLISFTNYGASAGIPGISTLLKQSRQIEQQKQRNGKRRRYDPDDYERPRSRRSSSRRRRRTNDWYYEDDEDDEDDEDLELNEIWEELQSTFQTQTDRLKTALTPASNDLEFHPSPQQLWNALEGGRYRVPQTLLVQFDRDDMDQSAKLATTLLQQQKTAAASTGSSKMSSDAAVANSTLPETDARATTVKVPPGDATTTIDLKFARLRGTHLAPISATKGNSPAQANRRNPGLLQELSSQSTKVLWKILQGRRQLVGDVSPDVALRDLRQSITRYIADVVTK